MIGRILIFLAAIIAPSIALANFFDSYANKEQKKQIRSMLEIAWIKLEDTDIRAVAQAPIHFLTMIFDLFFGSRIISLKSFWKSGIISIIMLIAVISLTGGIQEAPWTSYDRMFQYIEELKNRQSHDQYIKEIADKALTYNNFTWKITYSSVFLIFVLVSTAFFGFITLLITRQMMREMIEVKGFLLLFGALSLNLFIGIILSTFLLMLLWIASFPIFALAFYALLQLSLGLQSISMLLIISVIGGIGAWILSLLWLRVVAVVSIIPVIVLILMTILTIILYPVRKRIYAAIKSIVFHTIESERVLFIFVSITLSSLAVLILLLEKLLGLSM